MKRKIIETTVGGSLEIDTDYYCGTKSFPLHKLHEFLSTAKDQGATHITIIGSCYDGHLKNVDIQPSNFKLETDEDYAKRVSDEERKAIENYLHEDLKLKYCD